jgi:hypothetical protein
MCGMYTRYYLIMQIQHHIMNVIHWYDFLYKVEISFHSLTATSCNKAITSYQSFGER